MFIFVLFALTIYSQEKSDVSLFRPQTKDLQQYELERDIEVEKNEIKNSGFFSSLRQYLALKNEDLSLCSSRSCREEAQNLLSIRYLAEGRCGEIRSALNKRICAALKSNDTQNLSGPEKDFYEGLLNGDSKAMLKAATTAKFRRDAGNKMGKDDILEILGVYHGFKYYSSVACERHLRDKRQPLSKRISCQIIFSQDSERVIEGILNGLALFNLAKKQTRPDLCNLINNTEIKGACLNPGIKRLEDFW